MKLSYRRQGAPRSELAWVDPVKVPDPKAALEGAFGEELVLFEVLDGSEPVKRKHRRKSEPPAAAPGEPAAAGAAKACL